MNDYLCDNHIASEAFYPVHHARSLLVSSTPWESGDLLERAGSPESQDEHNKLEATPNVADEFVRHERLVSAISSLRPFINS